MASRIDLALGAMWTGRPAMQQGLADTRAYLDALGQLGGQLQRLDTQGDNVRSSVQQVNGALSKGAPAAKNMERDIKGVGRAVDKFANDVDDATDDLDSSLSRWGNITQIASFAIPILQQAGQKLVQFTSESVAAASDNAESLSKFMVVFGDEAAGATARLEEIADSAGRSSNEFIALAAGLQDTFVPLGFARDAAADMSTELIQLALDMGSFDNVRTADVVRDITSAIVGNAESVRKYGIIANQTAIDQKALEMGLTFTKGAMDAQTKAAATLQIIYESTADAQGDAARTAGEHANVQRSLESSTLDLQIAFGKLLIPTVTEALTVTGSLVNRLTIAVETMSEASAAVTEMSEATLVGARATKTLDENLAGINESYDLSRTLLGRFTGTREETTAAFLAGAQAIAGDSESLAEFLERIEASGVGLDKLDQVLMNNMATVGMSIEEWFELARAMDEASVADSKMGVYVDMYAEAREGLIGYTENLAESRQWQEYLTIATLDGAEAVEEYQVNAEALEAAEERRLDLAEREEKMLKLKIAGFDRWSSVVDGVRGVVEDLYDTESLSAEDAAARIIEANEAISESYTMAALEVAQASIAAQYGEDALAAQEAYLRLQAAMGTITDEQADKLIEVARTTGEVERITGSMMNRYLEDGVLAQEEIDAIAAAVGLIETTTYSADEAIVKMAESGLEHFPEVTRTAEELEEAAIEAAGAVGDIQNKMDLLEDKTVTVTVNEVRTGSVGAAVDWVGAEGDRARTGGARQHGGDVWPGAGFTVGEAGPEIFWPKTAGTIIPNDQIGGASYTDNRQIQIINRDREAAALTLAYIEREEQAQIDAYMGV